MILLVLPGAAMGQDAKVRASVGTKGDIWVGQRATLIVELLAPGFFSGGSSYDLPDPPGVLLVPPASSPSVGSEEIDGVSYTVQRHELSVIARRAGDQTIPPIAIRFHFKRNPLDKDAVSAAVKTPPVTFTAKSPPGAEKLWSIISARNLTAVETWNPEPGKAKAGDAFTRTVTFAAPDVPAMAFPVFPTPKIDGVGVYPKPPEVLDHAARGELSGERRDVTTFVCQRAGTFVIPAVRLSWFDLDAKEVQTIDFPKRTIVVAPNPAMPSTAPVVATSAPAPVASISPWFIAEIVLGNLVVIACAVWLVRRFGARCVAAFRPVHLAPLNPE